MSSLLFHFFLLLQLLLFTSSTFANTEIINLSASSASASTIQVSDQFNEDSSILRPLLSHLPRLSSTQSELILSGLAVSPDRALVIAEDRGQHPCENITLGYELLGPSACIPAIWIRLDIGGLWEEYERFTLRASWPASYPIDVQIDIYDVIRVPSSPSPPDNINATLIPLPRQKTARILIIDTAILTPTFSLSNFSSSSPTRDMLASVPLILVLEPLYFGIIPASVVPIIFALMAVVILGALAVGPIYRYLESVAARARVGKDEKVE